jgi:hypothetical protein
VVWPPRPAHRRGAAPPRRSPHPRRTSRAGRRRARHPPPRSPGGWRGSRRRNARRASASGSAPRVASRRRTSCPRSGA